MDIMLGGTHISGGIDQAVSLLTAAEAHKFAQKTIIIMTDGKWSEGVNPKTSATATTRVF